MKIIKKILTVALILLILLQLWRPEKNSAEYRDVKAFETETAVTQEVVAILETNCYDCHSNKTVYPWYAEIAPISIWIAGHVEEGNEHFNISEWASYSAKKKDHKLEELIEEVEEDHMPEEPYTWMHGTLSDNEKEQLYAWAKKARAAYSQ